MKTLCTIKTVILAASMAVVMTLMGAGSANAHFDEHSHGPYWHDTSHYDYHPGSYERHGNHYDYVPGHYDFHGSGHYDW